MSTPALAVGVSIAGLFVLIIVVVIVAFCVYSHQQPSNKMTRVKQIKKGNSSIKKKADDNRLQKTKDEGRNDGTGSISKRRCCCCTTNSDDDFHDEDDVVKTVQTAVIPEHVAIPQPPEDIVLEDPQPQEVTITWCVSDQDYIERFQIFKRLAKKSSVWTKIKTVGRSQARSCRIKKLDSDVRYIFGVVAKNSVGKSSIAESVPITLKQKPVLPGPPHDLVTWQKSGTTLTLSWKPPKFDGHLRITRYHISIRDENMEWRTLTSLQAFERFMDYRVTGLIQNVPYRFRVAAENDAGIGAPIETKDIVLNDGPVPPDKPRGPLRYYEVNHNSMSVSWQEPEQDGGQPVSGYAIELLDIRNERWRKVGVVQKNKNSFWINKLSEGCDYYVRVVAISNVGNSEPLMGAKCRTKILEIPLNQRSVSRLYNLSGGHSRGSSRRSLADSGGATPTARSRAKRSRSGKQRTVMTAINIEHETGNDVNSHRSRKYGKSENIETTDIGVATISGGLETVDIGVETERHGTCSTDMDDISTEVSSLHDTRYGKFRYLNNVKPANAVPSNVAYSFR